jgi:hypothetical protein
MIVVVDVIMVVALPLADENHSGHGQVCGHDLVQLSRDYERVTRYTLRISG